MELIKESIAFLWVRKNTTRPFRHSLYFFVTPRKSDGLILLILFISMDPDIIYPTQCDGQDMIHTAVIVG